MGGQNVPFGKRRSRWERFEYRAAWSWTWRRRLGGSVSQSCGHGRRISIFSGRFLEHYEATSSTSGGYSLNDVWRSFSRPSSLLRFVLQEALSHVMKLYLLMTLKSFADDMSNFLQGLSRELPDAAEKGLRAMRLGLEESCPCLWRSPRVVLCALSSSDCSSMCSRAKIPLFSVSAWFSCGKCPLLHCHERVVGGVWRVL